MRDEIVTAIERVFKLSTDPNSPPLRTGDNYAIAHNHPAGINARYAAEVLSHGRLERWEIPDSQGHVTLATRQVVIGREYLQLVFAVEIPSTFTGTIISFAWRLYGVDPGIRPTEAFGEVLARYGIDVRCGDRQERLMALETIEGKGFQLEPVGAERDHAYSVSGTLRTLPVGHTQAIWAFCVDDTRYAEDVARWRG